MDDHESEQRKTDGGGETSVPSEGPGGELSELSVQECFELLATQPVGRLAVAPTDGPPHVVPVNYRLDGEVIVFRSDPGLKVRLLREGPVAFQVDWVDWHHRTGWSVLVHGAAHEGDPDVDRVQLESWTKGDKRTWMRVVATSVSGRRIRPADLPWPSDARGYV